MALSELYFLAKRMGCVVTVTCCVYRVLPRPPVKLTDGEFTDILVVYIRACVRGRTADDMLLDGIFKFMQPAAIEFCTSCIQYPAANIIHRTKALRKKLVVFSSDNEFMLG